MTTEKQKMAGGAPEAPVVMFAFGYQKGETDQEMFNRFLDELKDSGITNMFGAAPYLQAAFDLEPREAKDALVSWMGSYCERKAAEG